MLERMGHWILLRFIPLYFVAALTLIATLILRCVYTEALVHGAHRIPAVGATDTIKESPGALH
jgi:hypothetical protein